MSTCPKVFSKLSDLNGLSAVLDVNAWSFLDVYACARIAKVAKDAHTMLIDGTGLLKTHSLVEWGRLSFTGLTWLVDPADDGHERSLSDTRIWSAAAWSDLRVLHVNIETHKPLGFLQGALRSAVSLVSLGISIDLDMRFEKIEPTDDADKFCLLASMRAMNSLNELELNLCFDFNQAQVALFTNILRGAPRLRKLALGPDTTGFHLHRSIGNDALEGILHAANNLQELYLGRVCFGIAENDVLLNASKWRAMLRPLKSLRRLRSVWLGGNDSRNWPLSVVSEQIQACPQVENWGLAGAFGAAEPGQPGQDLIDSALSSRSLLGVTFYVNTADVALYLMARLVNRTGLRKIRLFVDCGEGLAKAGLLHLEQSLEALEIIWY